MKKRILWIYVLLYGHFVFSQDRVNVMSLGITSFYQKQTLIYNSQLPSQTSETNFYQFYYAYTDLYQIEKTPFYFVTGIRLQYLNPTITTRIGLGANIGDNQKKMYGVFGVERSGNKSGLYGQIHFVFGKKRHFFVLSPEINYDFSNLFQQREMYFSFPRVQVVDRWMLGLSLGMGWDNAASSPKKVRKYAKNAHFSVEFGAGTISYYQKGSFLKDYKNFIHASLGYRIFAKRVISPEIGLGFIANYKPIRYVQVGWGHLINQYYYEESQNYLPYLKIGADVQTRGKVGFIGKAYLFEVLRGNALGLSAQVGVKFAISPKLALSISHEALSYAGKVNGWYRKFGEYDSNHPQAIPTDITQNGLHSASNSLYSLKIGVHF